MTVFALPMLTLSLTLLCVGQTQFTTTVTTVQSHLQFGAHPHLQPLFLFKRGHSPRRRRTRAPSLIAPTRMIQHLVRLGRGRSLAVPVLTSQLLRSKGLISLRRPLRIFLLTECMRQQHTVATLQFSNGTVGNLGDLVMLLVHQPVRLPTMTLGLLTVRLVLLHPCVHLLIAGRASYLALLHRMLPVHTSMGNLTLRVARLILSNHPKPI
jgi:hypothetical protein